MGSTSGVAMHAEEVFVENGVKGGNKRKKGRYRRAKHKHSLSGLNRCHYPTHWSADAVRKALEEGGLFKALFHVNEYNNLEAYCKIDGVQTDVLISGVVAENRAIEGDTVAIAIDPPSSWPRMKGSTETPNCLQLHEDLIHVQDITRAIEKLELGCDNTRSTNNLILPESVAYDENAPISGVMADKSYVEELSHNGSTGNYQSILEKLCSLVSLHPSKRPTGTVVAVMEQSPRRDNIVGFLSVKEWIRSRKKVIWKNKQHHSDVDDGFILLTPTDPKLTKMMVRVGNMPRSIMKRLDAGDSTLKAYLVAAKVVDWAEESHIPEGCVLQILGRGSDLEAQISAILFENSIDASEFSSEALCCIPHVSWEVELQSRRDLRSLCVFTIDPATPTDLDDALSTDLDDALSVERLPGGVFRAGVHIADVSYFVLPGTPLDIDAQIRSTSVYLLKSKISMLPPILSENLASLNPGVDRLTVSIFWDLNSAGEILDRWIGRAIIRSCSKLSYEHAQDIIDGSFDDRNTTRMEHDWPKLHGQFEWRDMIQSLKSLHEISKLLKENRVKNGTLSRRTPKVVFLFDEDGKPYDTLLAEQKDLNLVEEFMLLANMTVAEVITRAYPSCSLLRRHPDPNAWKLLEFDAFCKKHGLKLDRPSSSKLHYSLERMKKELTNDSVLFDILMSYAARPMQLSTYFCSGDLENNYTNSDCFHYSLSLPLYTHFTSPLRRYPDIVVHRTLAAILEAEDLYLKGKRILQNLREEEVLNGCFTGLQLYKDDMESVEAREVLSFAASKYGIPCPEILSDVAAHCNEKKLASRRVKDAADKLYMWALLKRKKILYSEARVLGLGPKFMSLYITKLAIERRIYYDEVEGLTVEWLDSTSTLLLSRSMQKQPNRKNSTSKFRPLKEIALIVNPIDLELEMKISDEGGGESLRCGGISNMINLEPSFFPLTIHLLSTITVALHVVGGDDGPLDIAARLFISSYL